MRSIPRLAADCEILKPTLYLFIDSLICGWEIEEETFHLVLRILLQDRNVVTVLPR